MPEKEQSDTQSDSSTNQVPQLIEDAGAPTEEHTERDGLLSWKAETHALVATAGVAFILATGSKVGLIGPVATAISAGLRGKAAKQPSVILTDIKDEPHYALGGLMVGALLGAVYRFLTGAPLFPV